MNREIHNPVGIRDIFGKELKNKRKVMNGLFDVFDKYGYEEIETGTVEYFDVFGKDIGTTPSNELYKFFDREGNTLVLRPDFTPSVARAAAMFFEGSERPLRLCYAGNTYVNHYEYKGMLNESPQAGVELIGESSPESDSEIIALTVESLKAAGIEEFQVSIGEVGFFKSLIKKADLSNRQIEDIRLNISRKNFFGVEEILEEFDIQQDIKEALIKLPQLFGKEEILSEADRYALDSEEKKSVKHLENIYRMIAERGLEKYVAFDFGSLSRYEYYTGIIFSAYTYGTGEPVAKGGRYDGLLSHFGKDEPAVGVGFSVNPILNALKNM